MFFLQRNAQRIAYYWIFQNNLLIVSTAWQEACHRNDIKKKDLLLTQCKMLWKITVAKFYFLNIIRSFCMDRAVKQQNRLKPEIWY